jgi:hypothetical protein
MRSLTQGASGALCEREQHLKRTRWLFAQILRAADEIAEAMDAGLVEHLPAPPSAEELSAKPQVE